MRLILICIIFLTVNCSSNKISKRHGSVSLEGKFEKIQVNKTNKNDVIMLIGEPSVVSDFNENKWFYFERKKTNQSLLKLGNEKIIKNNILILEFNNIGLLLSKKFKNIKDMNDVKFDEQITKKEFEQNSLIYNIFSSLRERANAPARNRNKSN